jgi:hypothetical protein
MRSPVLPYGSGRYYYNVFSDINSSIYKKHKEIRASVYNKIAMQYMAYFNDYGIVNLKYCRRLNTTLTSNSEFRLLLTL